MIHSTGRWRTALAVLSVAAVGAVVVANFATRYQGRATGSLRCCDEYEFVAIAENIAAGRGYSLASQPPFTPTLMREPGYPLLLAGLRRVFPGTSLLPAQVVNILLAVVSAMLLWRIARRMLPRKLALLPSLLFLLSPRVAFYSWTVLSELPAITLLLLAVLAWCRTWERGTLPAYALAGATFGLLALVKMPFVLLAPIATVGLWWYRYRRRRSTNDPVEAQRDSRHALVFLLGFVVVFGPWFLRNVVTFGTPTLTVRSGQLLFERTRHYPANATVRDFVTVVIGDLLPAIRRPEPVTGEAPIVSPYGVDYGVPSQNPPARFFSFLAQTGSEAAADRAMQREAFAAIAAHPFLYVGQLPFEVVKFSYPEFIPGRFGVGAVQSQAMVVEFVMTALLFLAILVLTIRGAIVLGRRNRTTAGVLRFVVLYTTAVHAALYVTPRYGFTVYPLLLIAVVAGVVRQQSMDHQATWWSRNGRPFVWVVVGGASLAAAGVNATVHVAAPIAAAVADALSTLPKCVSCVPGQFVVLDAAATVLLGVIGATAMAWAWYPDHVRAAVGRHARTLGVVAIVGALLLMGLSVVHRYVTIDEVSHAQSTWYVVNGRVPYVDFFEQHHPFLWYSLAPLLSMVGTSSGALILLRIPMATLALAIGVVIWVIARRLTDRATASLAILFAATTLFLSEVLIEVRPDVPQAFFALLGIAVFLHSIDRFGDPTVARAHARRFAIVGIWCGLAFLFIQKAVFLIAILGVFLVWECVRRRMPVRAVGWYILGVAGVVAPYAGYLWWTSVLTAYLENAWLVNLWWPIRFSPITTLEISWMQNTAMWLLGVYGIVRWWRAGTRVQRRFVALLVVLFLSTFSFKVPFRQYFVVVVALLTIAAAHGFRDLAERWRLHPHQRVLALSALLVVPFFFLLANAVPTNRVHLQTVQFILDRTAPDDLVYDSTEQLRVFRADPHYIWFAVDHVLQAYARFAPRSYDRCAVLRAQLPAIIIGRGAVAACGLEEAYDPTVYPEIFIRRNADAT